MLLRNRANQWAGSIGEQRSARTGLGEIADQGFLYMNWVYLTHARSKAGQAERSLRI